MQTPIEIQIRKDGKLLFTVREHSPREAAHKTSWYLRNKLVGNGNSNRGETDNQKNGTTTKTQTQRNRGTATP